METVKLNLARKWRSHDFEGIIGQDIAVKMLKNSLYAAHYFPVYLFAGQRGCGKTTSARVFARAINCIQLSNFQKSPKETLVPCGVCDSCVAMSQGRHQDFIEIDAASHTGVENMRNIIETASFLPLMGKKKVYLIDEAHMLSKAAFNALLKILEEPPQAALFILATTDPDKIIETVRSRCFKLFFQPIHTDVLIPYLQKICQKESIVYSDDCLVYIASHAKGSARDALNLLEQVRFSSNGVTKESVLSVLGHIDDIRLIELLNIIATGSVHQLLTFWKTHALDTVSSAFIWSKLITLIRELVWMHYGVLSHNKAPYYDALKSSLHNFSLLFLQRCLDALYKAEPLFLRTTQGHGLLEMILSQMCGKYNQKTSNSNNSSMTEVPMQKIVVKGCEKNSDVSNNKQHESQLEDKTVLNGNDKTDTWSVVLQKLIALDDPLLHSLFAQGAVIDFDKKTGKLSVAFPKKLAFFKEVFQENLALWQPVLSDVYGVSVTLYPTFKEESSDVEQVQSVRHSSYPQREVKQVQKYKSTKRLTTSERVIDVSDSQKWQKVNLVLRYFPGTVTEVHEVQ